MKPQGQFPLGGSGGKINVAVQRPTVNLKEAENVGEQAAAAAQSIAASPTVLSKHARFGPKVVTHPGLED